eukprot:TRINITY_DN3109_c0_g1_i8.p2 TRINITY_DN3109_c0_g1~~TRINITY_DN3109_c0_g1_i8.p2  ORF type:complete len:124 (-),score=43.67 TRINITY_DN3109_c0_g1_i8:91-462(-)
MFYGELPYLKDEDTLFKFPLAQQSFLGICHEDIEELNHFIEKQHARQLLPIGETFAINNNNTQLDNEQPTPLQTSSTTQTKSKKGKGKGKEKVKKEDVISKSQKGEEAQGSSTKISVNNNSNK